MAAMAATVRSHFLNLWAWLKVTGPKTRAAIRMTRCDDG